MGVAIVDAKTLTAFIESPSALQDSVDTFFKSIDADGDGSLSRNDIRDRIGKILNVETKSREEVERFIGLIFERFDGDRSESIDREEFKALATEILLALARGIGDVPVIVALHPDSLLSMAVQHGQS